MRIVFIGTVLFSARALQQLISLDANVVGVCTLESAPRNADHVDLSPIAGHAGIPTLYTPDINAKEAVEWIAALKPDVIFCFGWSRLIKQDLLKVAPMGVIGFHPAALPENRGRHPLIWALVLGLSETASTFFFMDEGADSGDVLSQARVFISPDDDAASLYERVAATAMEQVRSFLPELAAGKFRRTSQNHSQANVWRKREIADGEIDWRMPAEGVRNLVRGLTHPYVGAHFIHQGSHVKVWRCRVIKSQPSNLEPGKVLALGANGPIVKAGIDAVELVDFDPKPDLKAGDYL